MDWQIIIGFVTCFLGSGLVQFFIQRRDGKDDWKKKVVESLSALEDKVTSLDGEIAKLDKTMENRIERLKAETNAEFQKLRDSDEEQNARNSRIRILRFADELREGRRHSKESFEQALSDIDIYDKYCSKHPLFKNNVTHITSEYIREMFQERLEKRDFVS